MKCHNCQSEMINIRLNDTKPTFWCRDCGSLTIIMLDDSVSNLWPKSVENTKKLVKELIKAKDRNHGAIERLNRIERDNWEFMDLGDDDRR